MTAYIMLIQSRRARQTGLYSSLSSTNNIYTLLDSKPLPKRGLLRQCNKEQLSRDERNSGNNLFYAFSCSVTLRFSIAKWLIEMLDYGGIIIKFKLTWNFCSCSAQIDISESNKKENIVKYTKIP